MVRDKRNVAVKIAIKAFSGPEVDLRDIIRKNWGVILEGIRHTGKRGMTMHQIMDLRRSRGLIELHCCGSCFTHSGCGWSMEKELREFSKKGVLLIKKERMAQ